MYEFATNLKRLMARTGLTLDEVVERTGLDARTVKGILSATNNPHARTLHRLAAGLGVATDELFQSPALLAHRLFDRATNPAVEQAVEQSPHWFEDWTEGDFDELYSRFGTGGELTPQGIEKTVQMMNRNREVHRQVALVLESSEADLLVKMVHVLYHRISVDPN